MEKKLPKMFINRIDKELKNNERIYVASKEEEKEPLEKDYYSKVDFKGVNINQKLKAIFNSKNYIYKAEVEITQHGEKLKKRVIGRNGNYLITMENEKIPIDSIEDITIIK